MNNAIDAACNKIISEFANELQEKKPFVIAIDGNCAAGKTTVAHRLSQLICANVVHMDDFYLPFFMRTTEIMAKLGGNIDFDRLISEVLIPIRNNSEYIYKPFDCSTGQFRNSIHIIPKSVTIVEGSYSCHPCIAAYSDFKVFLSIPQQEQMKRIVARNGEIKAREFKDIWIRRENNYFETLDIKNKCDINFENY